MSTKYVFFFKFRFGGGGVVARGLSGIRYLITTSTRLRNEGNSWHNFLLVNKFDVNIQYFTTIVPHPVLKLESLECDYLFRETEIWFYRLLLAFNFFVSLANTVNQGVAYTVIFESGQVRNISSSS